MIKIKLSKKAVDTSHNNIGYVVGNFNHIEGLLKSIITHYIEPSKTKQEFMEEILLNNSIMNFSAKLKLFFYINDEEKWLESKKLEEFRKNIFFLNKVRNSFAHAETKVLAIVPKDKKEEAQIHYIIETFETNGKYYEYSADDIIKDFREKYNIVEPALIGILHKINEDFKDTICSEKI